MTDRPILFSGPMIRALLSGQKTQTRRVVKLPHMNPLGEWEPVPWGGPNGGRTAAGDLVPAQVLIGHTRTGDILRCPYGQPGDRLWVRETWCGGPGEPNNYGPGQHRYYRADYEGHPFSASSPGRWTPSIHMPRWASRITLEIAGVRVERLQAISEADALAEGVGEFLSGENSASSAYADLWESINGDGSWDANPWVWIIEFRRVDAAREGGKD